ncbi:MAG: hypothetical protein GX760_02035 [Erysipelothrix sp.]|nr:hypothetical protein [Erysipelothrix sp.]
MNKRKVIIDTDPGIDDLLALSIALASEQLDILAISTVYGNMGLEHTAPNAKLITEILEKDITLIRGSNKPLFHAKKPSATVHGNDGMGGLYDQYRGQTPERNTMIEGVSELYNLIKNSPDKITIIALGPLTNIATILLADETIADKIEEIHIMGGGDRVGNINELAEFNFFSDAYAAKIVLRSEIPIILSGLDVTHKVYFTDEEFEKVEDTSIKQTFIKDSVRFYANLDPYLHDVCSILTLTHSEFFTYKEVNVEIVASNDITDGLMYLGNTENKNIKIKYTDTSERAAIIKHITDLLNEHYK